MARRSPAPAPTLVLLVRHGQTATTGSVLPGRAAGLHLSETGAAQAEAAARRVATLEGIDAVYASPLERTRETAAPIARATGRRVRTAKGLLECDFGEWTGQELKALMKLPEWKQVQRYPSGFRFPGGESFSEMQTRIVTTIDRLRAAHPKGVVVAVSHADPIKAAVAHAMGTHLDLFQRIVVGPASISVVRYGPRRPEVVAVNTDAGDLSWLRAAAPVGDAPVGGGAGPAPAEDPTEMRPS